MENGKFKLEISELCDNGNGDYEETMYAELSEDGEMLQEFINKHI